MATLRANRLVAMQTIDDALNTVSMGGTGSDVDVTGAAQIQGMGPAPTTAVNAPPFTVPAPEFHTGLQEEEDNLDAWKSLLGPTGVRILREGLRSGRQARSNGQRNANEIKRRLAGVPIPGGIGVPLTLLLFLLMVIIPVNGHTRIAWLFLTLIGRAYVSGSQLQSTKQAIAQAEQNAGNAIVGSNGAIGASGDFSTVGGLGSTPGSLGNQGGVSSNPWSVPSSGTLTAEKNTYTNPYGFFGAAGPQNSQNTLGSSYADLLSSTSQP